MNPKNIYFSLLFSIISIVSSVGQELDLTVKVVVQGNTTSDQNIFKTFEKNVLDFMNSTKWTDRDYQQFERIKGLIQITITNENSPNNFTAEMIIQSERPVYNALYKSPMLSMIDKHIYFTFSGLQPLVRTNGNFVDNLSSILSFYAYIIIGVDNDSFSSFGGEDAFIKAQEIINTLSSNYIRDEGWRNDAGTKRNRFFIVNNMMHPRLRPFRQALYEYHRLSLDKMYDDSEKSRAILLSTLTSIGQVELDYPNTMMIQVFGDTKKDEIVEIFKVADRGAKNKVKTIMVGMDASKKEKYSVLN